MACILLLTGLSGAGKSTLADGLAQHMQQQGRQVMIVDGDVLRADLSEDLRFSPEDREENVRRAGAVARLIAKAGQTAVISMIAPSRGARRRMRESCEEARIPFGEVWVSTPLAVCIDRDPKGLYALAKSAQIQDLTGVGQSYEQPLRADLTLDTSDLTVDEAVQQLHAYWQVLEWGSTTQFENGGGV